jgi:eukaryotic-like serine/threonine-protein kinase
LEGTVLAGRYRLESKLGQGGMGSVWRAEHLSLGSPLAIKLIDPSIAQSAEALSRFKREAQAAADLRSPHVVQIIDYGVDADIPFIAMELLEGESLGTRLEKVGRLAPVQVASILSQAARALARAHQAGIVHRDLKPDNIFLIKEADDDVVKVLDFGIAKKLGALSTTSGIKTGTGAMLGTPYYMSPEQVLGQSNVDHRTDIWALGIIAYECLTGARPFEKNTLGALLMSICSEPLPIASSIAPVPSGFDAWFSRACARSVSERFASATEATTELRKICGYAAERLSIVEASGSDGQASAGTPTTQSTQGSAVMDLTAAPSSVTIPGLKQGWRLRSTLLALAALAGVTAAIWLAKVVMTQSTKREDISASSAAASIASPEPATALPPQSPIALVPSASTPVALPPQSPISLVPGASAPVAVVSSSPISQIKDLPSVPEQLPQARRASAPKSAPSPSADRSPSAPSSAASKAPPATSAAPATPKKHDYSNTIGF